MTPNLIAALTAVLAQTQEVKIAFFGDQGLGSSSESVLELVQNEGAHAIVHLGDFDYGDDPGAWHDQIQAVLPPCFPYFAIAGNHDEAEFSGYQGAITSMLNCAGITWHGAAGQQYSFTYQGLYFVLTTPGLLGSSDAEYVAARLASPAGQGAAWRISGWHLLMRNLQIGGKSDESGWPVYENSRLGGAIIATSHEHSYQRTNLLSDMSDQIVAGEDLVISEGKTFAFVSGLGGRSIRDQERCLPDTPPYGCNGTWASIYASNQGATHGALFITFRAGGDPCRARGYFKDIDGNVVDDFWVTSTVGPCADAGPPGPCDPQCPMDYDCDGVIGSGDLEIVLSNWDGYGIQDLLALLQAWGSDGCIAPTGAGVWLDPQEIFALPTIGPAWSSILDAAEAPAGPPNIADQDDDTDVFAMAKALVATRLGDQALAGEARALVQAAIGTEDGGRSLALARNLPGYVIAADLVGAPPGFDSWLADVRHEVMSEGRTLIETHERRPNNWGTMAGAARVAAALHLGDETDLARAGQVFRGWLGDRDAYADFVYGDLCWQANPDEPVGVNPQGASLAGGLLVDGVLPDDQRRGGCPPATPCENYAWEALQGAVATAWMLSRHGNNVWQWEDQALLRAVQWLHEQASCPAVGDDAWQPHVINAVYGTDFPAPSPVPPGENVSWTDWTHGGN